MANLDRVRVAMTGFPGGPGVMTFYAVSGSDMIDHLYTWLTAIAAFVPPDVTFSIEPSGDKVDDVDGMLTGAWTGTAVANVVGSGGGDYAAPSGLCVTWLTPIIRDGVRIKGRSFVVPLSGELYQNDGSIQPAALSTIGGASDTFVTNEGGNFRIWHRPRVAQPASPGHRALTAHDGSQAAVTSAIVHDRVAVLRSRRD